jgi:DNA polymerase-3 subunit gamma/tau
MVLQDLLELTHFLTKLKVSPELANDPGVPETERVRGTALAKGLSVPVLTRSWQMLLKGVSEVQQALNPQLALEMIIIRLLYISDQPTPGDAMKQLKDGSFAPAGAGAPMGNGGGAGAGLPRAQLRSVAGGGAAAAVATQAVAQPEHTQQTAVALTSFEDIVALAGQKREALLQSSLINDVHLVAFAPGHLSIRLRDGAAQTLVGQLSNKLSQWTGERWMVSLSREQGQPTIGQARKADKDSERTNVLAHPVVAEVMRVFPDASIVSIDNEQS